MISRPKRISIVLPDLRGGGVERTRLVLANEFRKFGYDIEFVLMQKDGELMEEAGALFHVVNLRAYRFRYAVFALAGYVRSEKPDVLLAGMWPLTAIAFAARLLARRRCKIIVSEHGLISAQYAPRGLIHRLLLRASTFVGYRGADACVGVSSGVADDMAKLSLMNRQKIHVIHNPIRIPDEASSSDLSKANALWGNDNATRILTVGRFKAVKNHSMLLRAIARLQTKEPVRLILLGNGECEDDLRELTVRLGLSDQVCFAGFRSDPTPFYQTADIFVLSSDYEGFGNVIVEALACGTPVVSTDCPAGPREILNDGEFGTLVPVGDEAALAEGIMSTLRQKPDAEKLRGRARDFSPRKTALKYLELLD